VVYHPARFVGKGSKCEYVCNGFTVHIVTSMGACVVHTAYCLDRGWHRRRSQMLCQDGCIGGASVLCRSGASYAVPGALHVALCRGGAGIQVLED
jgi:hypothetical protein